MLFKGFSEQRDEIVLICTVINPLSRTFLKNLNERCLLRRTMLVKDFKEQIDRVALSIPLSIPYPGPF